MTTITRVLYVTAILLAMFGVAFVIALGIPQADASVPVGNDYIATSTAASTVYGATITGSTLIRTGGGSLGSIVITGAATGVVNIYNATTTNVNNRTNKTSTSTILIASIPASAAAGTYTFDVQFSTGLYIDLVSGTMPTSTITYRPF